MAFETKQEDVNSSANQKTGQTPNPFHKDVVGAVKAVESTIYGLSVRSVIALILVLAIVVYPFLKISIPEVVSNLAIAAVSYYFGKTQSPSK